VFNTVYQVVPLQKSKQSTSTVDNDGVLTGRLGGAVQGWRSALERSCYWHVYSVIRSQ